MTPPIDSLFSTPCSEEIDSCTVEETESSYSDETYSSTSTLDDSELSDSDDELSLTKSQEIGARFILEKKLGQGGFGQVWLAEDSWLNQSIALKMSKLDMLNEVTLLRQLPKERYISIFDYIKDEDTGSYGYTMEVLQEPWMTLDYFYKEKLLPKFEKMHYVSAVKQIILVAVDLLTSLSHLHGKKHSNKDRWYHADIKPNNLYIHSIDAQKIVKNRWGDIIPPITKIGDLGLADKSGNPAISGTRGFMPPEQKRWENLSPSADIYALAQTLIYLFSGDLLKELTHVNQIEKLLLEYMPSNYLVIKLTRIIRKMTYSTASSRPPSQDLVGQFKQIVSSDDDWVILTLFSGKDVALTKNEAAKELFEELKIARGWQNYTGSRIDEMKSLIKRAYKVGILKRKGLFYSLR
jgi:serine/threonine protein kinase